MKVGCEPPPLTAEGIVGAAFGVLYARLIQDEPAPLRDLLNALMATIVLPYRGHADAARELARLTTAPSIGPGRGAVRPHGTQGAQGPHGGSCEADRFSPDCPHAHGPDRGRGAG